MSRPSIERVRAGQKSLAPPLAGRTAIEAEREALSSMILSLRRNVRLIAAVTVTGTVLIVLVVMLGMTPQYAALASVLVDSRKTQILKDQEVLGRPGTENSAIESEAEMLKSPTLLRQVAMHLKLENDPEYKGKAGPMRWVRGLLAAPFQGAASREEAQGDPYAAIVERLKSKVQAKRRNLTYVIELTVWSRDAAKAATLANKIAEFYLAEQIAAKNAAAGQATQWLNDEIEKLRSKVAASESAYEQYKAEAGLFAAGGENLADKQMSQLNEQLVMARARAAEAQAKFQQLALLNGDKLRSAAASPDILQSTVLVNLRNQHAEVGRKEADLTTRYGPRHPQVIAVQAERENLLKQIRGEVGRIVASAKTEFEMAKSREESLAASLDELKAQAGQFHQKAVRLRELEREATANRGLLEAFLGRAKETAAQLNMQMTDSRILASALPPLSPAYPQKSLIVGLGFFGSLGMGLFLALARGMLGAGFRRAADLQTAFGLHPLATIPLVEMPSARLQRAPASSGKGSAKLARLVPETALPASRRLANLVVREPNSLFSESIQSLRLALRHAGAGHDIKTLLITSALPGEGKSTIAANLARAMALCGDRVLFIDADLRRPTVAANMGITQSFGLADVLSGQAEMHRAVLRDSVSGLHVLAGNAPAAGVEALSLLSSRELGRLLEAARSAYDIVLLDSAPLLPVADPRILVAQVEGVALVVASELTARSAIQAALQETPGLESKVLGAVMNRVVNDYGRSYGEYTSSIFKVA